MKNRILLLFVLSILGTPFLQAQTCTPLSDNINLGGTGHDSGFQGVDNTNAAATLSNGNFVLAWETRDGVDGDGEGAFFQVFSADGSPVSGVIMPYADVNGGGTGNQGAFGPKVVALQTGFVVAWVSEDGPGDTGPSGSSGEEKKDVFFRTYNNNGGAVSGSVRLDNNGKEDNLVAILPLSTGEFVMLTAIGEDAPGDNTDDLFFQTFNAQGMAVSNLINVSGGAHDGHFQNTVIDQAMAELSDGKFAVTWEARDGIDGEGNGGFFRIFRANGTFLTGVVAPYFDINPTGAGDQATFGSRVIGLPNGNLVMAWGSGPSVLSEDVYFRVYNSNGMAVSATTQVDEDQNGEARDLSGIVALTDGNFAVLYKSTSGTVDYFVRTYNANGVALGSSVEVSGGLHTNFFSAGQSFKPSIIALNNGNFAVCWAARDGADGDQSGVFYRVFNSSGLSVSGVVAPYSDFNAGGTGNQSPFGPVMTTLAGGFVIAWESEGGPGDVEKDVYHRVINNDGTPFCGTTKTNSGNDAQEENIQSIHPLVNGDFVLVYKDEDDDNKDDLFARVINGVPKEAICPTIGSMVIEPNPVCPDGTITITVSGLENMAKADNGDQDFGIRIVKYLSSSGPPYSSVPTVGTVSFDQLTNGGTTAVFSDITPDGINGNNRYAAILSPAPTDIECRPYMELDLTYINTSSVSFTAPADIFEDAGVQTGLGGGSPAGGVYSGPGVTDDGNGMTYSFDPAAAGGVGTYTITYTYTNGEGCEGSASNEIKVLEKQLEISPIGDINGVDDTSGVALSINQEVAIQGIVHCIDFDVSDTYSFWILEPNGDGMLVNSFKVIGDYEATEGDEIMVEGIIEQIDGHLSINPSEITLVSQDNNLVSPIATSELNESLENKLVTLEITASLQDQIEVVDFEDGDYFINFPTEGGTFTVFATAASGIDTTFLNEYINSTDVSSFQLTGFVFQVDEEAPYHENYYLVTCSEISFDFVSGVNEPAWAGQLLVYPNPATYQVNINAPVRIETLRLLNMQGRVLQNEAVNNNAYTLDLSALPKGVYQIRLIGEGGMVNRQIVRQ